MDVSKEMSSQVFNQLAKYAEDLFGLEIDESKRRLLHSRIQKRLTQVGIESFEEYRDYLFGEGKDVEVNSFISAMTTNVTQFFREEQHFSVIKDECFPVFREKIQKGDVVRIWCAGCSTGQEAYTLAITAQEYFCDLEARSVKILATDVDLNALNIASRATYSSDKISDIPKSSQRFFQKKGDQVTVRDEVRRMISFRSLNLFTDWPFRRKFDIIMCRNVAIYFSKQRQEVLWGKFADQLLSGGRLFIGHSERISGSALDVLTPSGVTAYSKS